MSLGCPECGSLETNNHKPGCKWAKDHAIVGYFVWMQFNGQLTCQKIAVEQWREMNNKTQDGYAWRSPIIKTYLALDKTQWLVSLDELTKLFPCHKEANNDEKFRLPS